mmetsp:Transcript_1631/g.2315  ORF Transcript_1631/g.2315 Transcript_1631/m.2315 type:complete len:106 (-) Transcript_1631:1523-1840(-)
MTQDIEIYISAVFTLLAQILEPRRGGSGPVPLSFPTIDCSIAAVSLVGPCKYIPPPARAIFTEFSNANLALNLRNISASGEAIMVQAVRMEMRKKNFIGEALAAD